MRLSAMGAPVPRDTLIQPDRVGIIDGVYDSPIVWAYVISQICSAASAGASVALVTDRAPEEIVRMIHGHAQAHALDGSFMDRVTVFGWADFNSKDPQSVRDALTLLTEDVIFLNAHRSTPEAYQNLRGRAVVLFGLLALQSYDMDHARCVKSITTPPAKEARAMKLKGDHWKVGVIRDVKRNDPVATPLYFDLERLATGDAVAVLAP